MRKNSNKETELPLTISSKDGLVDQVTFFNKKISSKDMSGYYLLKKGEFAYNKSYSNGYDFGSIKRLERYEMGALSSLYICFSLKKHCSDYIKHYFESLKWYRQIYIISAEGARNHGLLNVPTDDFFATRHFLSQNIEEQQKIADFLSLVDLRIEKQRQLVESLKKYKRGLFQELFVDFDRIPSSGHNHMIFIGKYSPVSTKKGVYTMKITANTQFKTLINTWLIQKRPMVTPSTHANFVLIVENHLIPYFGRKKISAITEADIQTYINTLYNEGRLDKTGGLTVKTIRDIILVLRLCLIFAYKEHVISMLNWDLIEYPKDFAVKNIISLSKDEELALIQCIYMKMNRRTAGVLIALFTGIRIGELCGLKMQDISIIDKTITIQRTVQRIYNKTTRTSYVYVGAPKTASSARTIPLPSLLVNIIKKYYTDNPNQYFLTGKTKPTEPRTYRQFFVRFLKKHKLRSVKFHEIRHTFAVRAIEIPEFDIKSLSEILGHKNVSFTLNVYGRANMQQKIKCMNLLNELL